MKIGIVVNDVDTEVPTAATTVIAHAASRLEHDVHMIGMGDLTYYSDGSVAAISRMPPRGGAEDNAAFLASIQGRDAPRTPVSTEELDVLYLRYNPEEDEKAPAWERDAGMAFGRIALKAGTLVLNDPYSLSFAVNKMYLEHFPASIRPRSVITRDVKEVAKFYDQEGGQIVVKPTNGYGGKDVYLLKGDATNLPQIVESIGRYSYVIAQEYMPEAKDGDVRMFLVNGRPLKRDGRYAAVRRINDSDDFRSNMTAGAKPHKAEITQKMLEIAEIVRPRLVADGMFEVGIDIVGDKLVEINTISSGGLNIAGVLEGVDFGEEVIRAIERKVEYRRQYGVTLRNRELATME